MERVEAGIRSGVKMRPIDIASIFIRKTRREAEAADMKKELEDLRFINMQMRGVGQKKRQLLKGSTYREADRAFLHERGWL
jgi:hypothetical protein